MMNQLVCGSDVACRPSTSLLVGGHGGGAGVRTREGREKGRQQ